MNYYDYFTEIEDTFISRRGKTLLLSPVDWALIESWKQRGVPLHVALNGIARVFDAHHKQKRKRTIKSLAYCAEEVEALFAEWTENQVGNASPTINQSLAQTPHAADALSSNTAQNAEPVLAETADAQKAESDLGIAPEAITHHLSQTLEAMETLATRHQSLKDDDFGEALSRVVKRLRDLQNDARLTPPRSPAGLQNLETALSELERMLDARLASRFTANELTRFESETHEQLAPYKKRMAKEVYQTTFANLLLKRLRRELNLPRLSLFHL